MSLVFRLVGTLAAVLILAPAAGAAEGDWHDDASGKVHRLSASDLPQPYATKSAVHTPSVVTRPTNAVPKAPAGFTVRLFTDKLEGPRLIRIAPNGDIFVAESRAGRIAVLRAGGDGGKPTETSTFTEGLDGPFGIAFYPPGPDPQFVYIGDTDGVVRFPYRNGDLKARGPAETLVHDLWSSGGHRTRDVVFSRDGKTLFVSVGSGSNYGAEMPKKSPEDTRAFQAKHALGAAWDDEENRADVLAFDPQGKNLRVYAAGIRNCVTMPMDPATGAIWCATNERDGLGDNLPPDYVTSVRQGAFYGWPWYYIGDHRDPRHDDERPDLAGHVTVPDVLIQPHSAPLQGVFYDGAMFPEFRGSLFVALHGSWNRATRTGYKIVRVLFKDGKPSGSYEDFLTGFILGDREVWGRPVGVAVDRTGALLIAEDGNSTIWRVTRQ
ncbi:MAG TPA: PQQ-dependent sugar dehydrogenase [Stellaceae bacterium]|nr:PQQ-dependent sugar dehydrogenase [Stellaceae bacterium]